MSDNTQDIFDRIMSLPRLRRFYGVYKAYKQVLLYLLFGGVTTFISIGSFVLLDPVLGFNELVANIGSWVLAVGFAYVANRTWVFRSRTTGSARRQEVFSFYSGRLATLGLEEGLLLIFVTWLGWNSTAVKTAVQILVLAGNYILSKWIVFRKAQR